MRARNCGFDLSKVRKAWESDKLVVMSFLVRLELFGTGRHDIISRRSIVSPK